MNHYDNPGFFAAYAQMARSQGGLESAGEWPQLKLLMPELSGKSVLDLGCGYGWHCKYAAEHGAADVLGIDQSRLMIEEATRRNADGRIQYCVCSLLDFEYPERRYDFVISNLALHYVEDIGSVFHRIHRTLQPGGVFVMNIEHPTFTAGVNQQFSTDGTWPVDNYFYPGIR